MYSINGTKINLTRGDTFKAQISIKQGTQTYNPANGDVIRFAMKRRYFDEEALITKTIPNATLLLELEPEDTKELEFGDYVFDIQITFANGDIDTFISGTLKLVEEVD